MNKPNLRIVFRNGTYCITEVHYDESGKPVKALDDECGILSYWLTVKELRKSYNQIAGAFRKPILVDTSGILIEKI